MSEKEMNITRRDLLIKGVQMAGGIAALTSMGGLLSACAKVVTNNNGTVTGLIFQTWTSDAKEVIDTQIAQFKKINPNLNVSLQILSYDDYWKKLPISISGGTGPDLFIMTRPNFETFAKSNQAANITQEVKNSAKLQENLANMNSVFVQTYQFKGETRGIPFGVDCTGIVYNKTLIQKEGLKLPSEMEKTWSWNELRDYAVKLTKRSGDQITQYGYFVSTNRMPTFEYIWSNGGELFNPAGDQCTIASKEAIQAIQFYADLMLKDKVSPTPDFTKSQSSDDLFMSGKIVMMNAGNWTMAKYRGIKDFEWDVAELPSSPNTGKKFVSSNVLGYIVGPNTKAKKEIIALLEQLTTKESQQVYAEKGVYIPTRTDAQEPFFNSDTPKNLKAFQRALSYSKPMALSEWVSYPEVLRITGNAMEQILSGKVPVEQGMKSAEDEINKIIKENKAKG
ncbi:sugar ABC transporter substrate-binding protein [Paenibacillus filicis]|uniref:Sugar ABC transporter substrate-binding protein n=1 Tax=Paenibacillus gyeongsangnamensis TaxID=3388067 RepID=A0ABT4Q668_9BACL|nr:sugar ABC transporter substrate-binding protein [Paenibacillus filicis]MCZ8512185.1 sugar ABC transporter substrate-binding protein [Paenibacillus filicis]